ncbi:MAG TPA: hypothetical protein PL100_07030 [Bacillota bacterium]|jgi:hypothetical protein|nr:hypothetical protein [Bacillota bacterium]HQC49251.1 hypothetical protein [Bacillota bacterium]
MPFIISSEYGDNNQCRRGPCAGYDTREDSNDLQIVIEALKIEKVSRHRLVRLWFLLLFAVAATTYLTMPKNMNVIVYREQLLQFLLTREAFPFPPREFFDAIIRKAFLIAVSMYFLLLYAVSWVDSQLYKTTVHPMFGDEMPTETGDSLEESRPASRLKGLHYLKFLTLAIATVVPYLLSIPLLKIPLYIFLSTFSMTILIIVYEDKKIPDAMEASYEMTRGMKFFIFVSFMFLNSILSIVSSALQMIFSSSTWSSSLINAFFYALKTLACGRLIAMLYRAITTGDLKKDVRRI